MTGETYNIEITADALTRVIKWAEQRVSDAENAGDVETAAFWDAQLRTLLTQGAKQGHPAAVRRYTLGHTFRRLHEADAGRKAVRDVSNALGGGEPVHVDEYEPVAEALHAARVDDNTARRLVHELREGVHLP